MISKLNWTKILVYCSALQSKRIKSGIEKFHWSKKLRKTEKFSFKAVIARYRFSLDIVRTLPIYYFMPFEYMCEVSKLFTIRNPRKLSFKKKLKKRLNTEFSMLHENWTTFSITVNKYFLPLQSNFFCKIGGCFTLHLAKFRSNWPSNSEDKNL